MINNSVQLKCSWKNCLIWAPIMVVLGLAVRAGLWYLMIYMGSVDVFSDYFCDLSLGLLLASVLIPLVCYVLCYRSYMVLAGNNPHRLHEISVGTLGKPWLAPFIGLLVAGAVWTLVTCLLVYLGCELDLGLEDDQEVLLTFLGLNLVNLAVDVLGYFLGKKFFKPDLVQNH